MVMEMDLHEATQREKLADIVAYDSDQGGPRLVEPRGNGRFSARPALTGAGQPAEDIERSPKVPGAAQWAGNHRTAADMDLARVYAVTSHCMQEFTSYAKFEAALNQITAPLLISLQPDAPPWAVAD